jgi:hypothetical protein
MIMPKLSAHVIRHDHGLVERDVRENRESEVKISTDDELTD